MRALVLLTFVACVASAATMPSPDPDPAYGNITGGEMTSAVYDAANDVFYVAGDFTGWTQPDGHGGATIVPRHGIAALTRDGVLLPWAPSVDGEILGLALDGTTLYLFGYVTAVDGVARSRIAAVSTVDGSLLPFDAQVVGSVVDDGVVIGGTLYFGGGFTQAGGQPRAGLAAVDAVTAALQPWDPGCDGTVVSMAAAGSTIYIGGWFSAVGGATRHHAAAVDTAGTLLAWDPDASGSENSGHIKKLVVAHGAVFAGGFFETIGGATRTRFAALDPTTGAALPGWDLPCDQYVDAMSATADGVFIAGGFTHVAGQQRAGLAFVTAAGALDPWTPTSTAGWYGATAGGGGVFGGAGAFFAFPALPADPTAGQVATLLHLGARDDRITGFPASGQEIMWDELRLAGWGPEEWIQPSAGVGVQLVVAATRSPLVWTALAGVTPRPATVPGRFLVDDRMCYFPPGDGSAGQYVSYYGLWFTSPSARAVRLRYRCADRLQAWLDGSSTPLLDDGSDGGADVSALTSDIALGAGTHRLVLKLYNGSGVDYLALAFELADPAKSVAQQLLSPGAPVTDFAYPTADPVPPTVASVSPSDGSVAVPRDEAALQVTFSEAMDTGVDPATAAAIAPVVAGTWSWPDRLHLCFTPAAALPASTTFTVTLDPASCRDAGGNALGGTASFGFTTDRDRAPAPTGATPSAIEAAAFSFALAGSDFAQAAMPCLPGWSEHGGHRYVLRSPGTDWATAEQGAEAAGGHLATIGDADEDAFLWQQIGRANGWVGCSAVQGAPDHAFTWVDGTPFTYANWSAGEPNDADGSEDFGIYWWGFRWNDVGSGPGSVRPYVIEFDRRPPPSVVLRRAGQADIPCTVTWGSASALTVAGDATLAQTGAWDVVVTNPDGISATLAAGVTIVDTTPPHVAITSPTGPGTRWSGPIVVRGTADDGGRPVAVTWSLSGATTGSGAATGGAGWSFQASLDDGVTHVAVTATDGSGNTAVAGVDVTCATASGVSDPAEFANGGSGMIDPSSGGYVDRAPVLGSVALIACTSGPHGRELWRTDGTRAGTALVKDIARGAASSDPWDLTAVPGVGVFFSADDGAHGRELWCSDGTAGGTRLVTDIAAGAASAYPDHLTAVGSLLFFTALEPSIGRSLWVSDGTAGGTTKIADVDPSPTVDEYSYDWHHVFCAAGGKLFFNATEPGRGSVLWVSDGTVAGTHRVIDVAGGQAGGTPIAMTAFQGRVFYTSVGDGSRIWSSDGTAAGTQRFSAAVWATDYLTGVGDRLYARGTDGSFANGIWVTDGNPAHLSRVSDVYSAPGWFIGSGISAFCNPDAPAGLQYRPLVGSDGTADGTALVADLSVAIIDGYANIPLLVGRTLWFASDSGDPAGWLYTADGTAPGATLVTTRIPAPAPINAVGGRALIAPAAERNAYHELWASDGTDAGTLQVFPIAPTVTAVSMLPQSGSALRTAPTSIAVRFSRAIDATTISTASVRLVRSVDGVFGDGDDAAVAPTGVALTAADTATIDLTGVTLADDRYRIVVAGSGGAPVRDLSGAALDGDLAGAALANLPSGDDVEGGDFVGEFALDTHAPTLAFIAPVSGGLACTTALSPVTIAGTATDADAVASVTWAMTGATIASGTATGTTAWSFGPDLNLGTTTVTVTATDRAGNASSGSITVVYDPSAAGIVIVSPSPVAGFATAADHVVVSGTAASMHGIVLVDWTLAGATTGSGAATGTDSWSFTTPTLAEGASTATVRAHDGAGNVAVATIAITRDTVAPTIVARALVLSGPVPDGATAMRVDGLPGGSVAATIDAATATWSATVPVPTITTVVSVVASDGEHETSSTLRLDPLVEVPPGGG